MSHRILPVSVGNPVYSLQSFHARSSVEPAAKDSLRLVTPLCSGYPRTTLPSPHWYLAWPQNIRLLFFPFS
ncbi:hypothetical protein E2C01_034945 [Portunus trituberculatus]|uniref:Uncharacterized protein n=1 Tax=Portunus trituberculatus TaxID=210409 RepID=A0A5B7F6W7_PORTR|nr:hypothetical protein [Portunus trituberculatus]